MSPGVTLLIICFLLIIHSWSCPQLASCNLVAISEECKQFCESKRPTDISADNAFTIDCDLFTTTHELTRCTNMCDKGKCPSPAVCSSSLILNCPPKTVMYVNAAWEEFKKWESTIMCGGIVVGSILIILLIALCVNNQIQQQRDMKQLILDEQEESLMQNPEPVPSPHSLPVPKHSYHHHPHHYRNIRKVESGISQHRQKMVDETDEELEYDSDSS